MSDQKDRTDDGGAAVRLGHLGDFVGFRLRRIQNQLSRDFSTAVADHNIRAGLFSSLAIISNNAGMSQNDLAHEVGLDKSVIVQIIDELERRKLATRGRSETDRRRHALTITPEGEAYLQTLFAVLEKTERAVLSQLSKAERYILNDLLDRMYAAAIAPPPG